MTPELQNFIRDLTERVSRLERHQIYTDTIEPPAMEGGAVDSVNGQTGVVVLDADDIDETASRIWFTSDEESKLSGIEIGANNYTHPNHTGDVTSIGDGATTIANDAVTNAKAANMAQATIKGRETGAGTGDPTDLTATQVRTILNVADGANAYVHPNHSGDVVSIGDGPTSIAADVVNNSKLANMAESTVKGRATGAGTGDPTDLTATQIRTLINVENGADVTDAGNVGSTIHGATAKTTPVDADTVGLIDSEVSNVLKKISWSDIKTTLTTLFNGAYVALTGNQTIADDKTFTGNIIITNPDFPPLQVERAVTATNTFFTSQDLLLTTSNGMTDGFGPVFSFSIQDNAGVENQIAFVGAVRNGVDNSGKFILGIRDGGAATYPVVVTNDGNISFNGGLSPTFAGGEGVIYIGNRAVTASLTPTGGGVLFAASGGLYWKGSSGTLTNIAPA